MKIRLDSDTYTLTPEGRQQLLSGVEYAMKPGRYILTLPGGKRPKSKKYKTPGLTLASKSKTHNLTGKTLESLRAALLADQDWNWGLFPISSEIQVGECRVIRPDGMDELLGEDVGRAGQ